MSVIFVMFKARQMFEGEQASLEAIIQTGAVRVPKPIKVTLIFVLLIL